MPSHTSLTETPPVISCRSHLVAPEYHNGKPPPSVHLRRNKAIPSHTLSVCTRLLQLPFPSSLFSSSLFVFRTLSHSKPRDQDWLLDTTLSTFSVRTSSATIHGSTVAVNLTLTGKKPLCQLRQVPLLVECWPVSSQSTPQAALNLSIAQPSAVKPAHVPKSTRKIHWTTEALPRFSTHLA